MNLVSNDVSRLDSAIYYIHYIWMAPLQVILVSYFLYTEVDRAAFAGILLQFLFMPLQGEEKNLCFDALRWKRALCDKSLVLCFLFKIYTFYATSIQDFTKIKQRDKVIGEFRIFRQAG